MTLPKHCSFLKRAIILLFAAMAVQPLAGSMTRNDILLAEHQTGTLVTADFDVVVYQQGRHGMECSIKDSVGDNVPNSECRNGIGRIYKDEDVPV